MSDIHSKVTKTLTEWLTKIVESYEEDMEDEEKGSMQHRIIQAKIEAINELIIDLNDPIIFVDTSGVIQQTVNVITANKIINNDL